jgi:hypothetical protein
MNQYGKRIFHLYLGITKVGDFFDSFWLSRGSRWLSCELQNASCFPDPEPRLDGKRCNLRVRKNKIDLLGLYHDKFERTSLALTRLVLIMHRLLEARVTRYHDFLRQFFQSLSFLVHAVASSYDDT